jgi:hypothetical protein
MQIASVDNMPSRRPKPGTPPVRRDSSTRGAITPQRRPALVVPPVEDDEEPGPGPVSEDEERVYSLVAAVEAEDGRKVPPEWAVDADVAERRGYITRRSLRLYITGLGKQYLAQQSVEPTALTMTKLSEHARYQLKVIAKEWNVTMIDALNGIVGAVYAKRADLAAAALRRNADPWHLI